MGVTTGMSCYECDARDCTQKMYVLDGQVPSDWGVRSYLSTDNALMRLVFCPDHAVKFDLVLSGVNAQVFDFINKQADKDDAGSKTDMVSKTDTVVKTGVVVKGGE